MKTTANRRQFDRHRLSPQVSVSVRVDPEDYEPFAAAFEALGISRRQAVIAAIRDWTRKHDPETTETTQRGTDR